MDFKSKQKTLFGRVRRLKENATRAERCFEEKLKTLGIKYIFQKGFINRDYYCIVDFYLPKPYKLCIEIDGQYHFSEEMIKKDKAKDEYLKSRKFKILHLTNDLAEKLDAESIKALIDK